jgi:predicted chitinase
MVRMILSPPFLPARTSQSEAAWLDAAMAQPTSRLWSTNAPEGSFPLSLQLAWHNGIHIQAPQEAGAYLTVRAIADGTVVFAHPPTERNNDVTHALNYNPFHSDTPSAAWTSDGFVVIEHEGEIGAAGTVPTAFVYYSACMHLGSIARHARTHAPLKAGDRVFRKEELGTPGQIYGHEGQVHFEICCDEANLEALTTRKRDWVDPLDPHAPTANGRTDSVFGSLYIYLPAGTPTRSSQPTSHLRSTAHTGGAASAATDHFLPDTLRAAQWVQISYERGSATLTSHDRLGAPIGHPRNDSRYDYISNTATRPGASQSFEYDLSAVANDRHGSLDAATQATSSPSGWYELLRFGRNLGPDALPASAAHWRKVVTPDGGLWVDLHAPGTFQFSDADFLPVTGWNCFDDDPTTNDQRCDSLHLKTLIRDPDRTNDRRMERAQLARRLGEPEVRNKLRRAICKFPSEWDRTNVESRYGWLETEDFKPTDDDATGAQKWERFVKHAKAVTFSNLPDAFLKADWRFHPREFVGHMRKCGWLSCNEMEQIHKDHDAPENNSSIFSAIAKYQPAFNRMTQKYSLNTKKRLPHILGQGAIESDFLKTMQETAMSGVTVNGEVHGNSGIHPQSKINESQIGHWWGFNPNERVDWYGSKKYNSAGGLISSSYNWRMGNLGDPDAQKFRGRGFKQLTGRDNYVQFWVYRGWLATASFDQYWWSDPQYIAKNARGMHKTPGAVDNPEVVGALPYNCMDAGGWYMTFQRSAVLRAMDGDLDYVATSGSDQTQEADISKAVTHAINGGEIGWDKRLKITRVAKKILLDD